MGAEGKEASAKRRLDGEVIEDDMTIFEGDTPSGGPKLGPKEAEASGPYMGGRLRCRYAFWKGIGACQMVLEWIRIGFMAWFTEEVPVLRKPNQESCYEPEAHRQFITESMEALKARGVVREWNKDWGEPRVISPLKVVPKKGGKLRLILDLFKLNKYLKFPRFRYDSVKQIPDLFEEGDAWDAKDGYWHVDLHADMWQYMCFEWEGQILFFAVMPFGLAPACWVFTK